MSSVLFAVQASVLNARAALTETVTLKSDGSVKFLAVGRPSALKINGEGSAPEGDLTIVKGQATGVIKMDVSSFKTGIETRDHHMKEKYLEVGSADNKYATLTLLDCTVPASFFDGAKAESKALPFKGKLRLHGVEQELSGTVDLTRDGKAIKGASKFDIDIPAYKIAVPSFAGITVAKIVTVEVSLSGVESLPFDKPAEKPIEKAAEKRVT